MFWSTQVLIIIRVGCRDLLSASLCCDAHSMLLLELEDGPYNEEEAEM